MKRLAEIFGHDFKDGNFKLFDKNKNQIYFENSDRYWEKREYNKYGKPSYFENSNGYQIKRKYDKDGNKIYYENSDGKIIDDKPKTCINKEIEIDGKKYKLIFNEKII